MNQDQTRMLEEAVRRLDDNITGILIQKDGETRYENYFHGYSAENDAHVAIDIDFTVANLGRIFKLVQRRATSTMKTNAAIN